MKKISNLIFIVLLLTALIFTYACNKDDNVNPDLQGVKMIAHRGLSSKFYQNTEEAFIKAGESSYFYGIETDVRPTLDKKWVCTHDNDPFLDKTKLVSEINYEEALRLSLNPDKSSTSKVDKDYYLCDFETYLKTCKKYSKVAVIEIKFKATKAEAESLLTETKKTISLDKAVFISFERDNLDYIKEIDSSAKIIILTNNFFTATALSVKGNNIGLSSDILSKDLIEKTHKKGGEVNVWTVNDIESVNKYKEWGVDYITTDYDFEE